MCIRDSSKRGDVKLRFKDYRGTIQDYNIAIEFDPPNSEYFYIRGLAKGGLYDDLGAIKDYNSAIEINPTFSRAFLARGLSKLGIDEIDSGCLDFSKAGELGLMEAYDLIKKFCN